MKKLIALFTLAAAFVFSSVTQAAVDMTDPYKMVSSVAEQAFTKIKANQDKMKDINFRKELVRNELLPYVDTRYAAFKVMGKNLKSISKEDRDAFADVFAEYIVSSFADALALYNQQDLIAPEYKQVSQNATQVNAKFLIREAGKPDLELVFKLRKNNKTNEWRAFDMVAEGISMLTAKESELSPLIRERGIKKVIALIEEHNKTGNSEIIK